MRTATFICFVLSGVLVGCSTASKEEAAMAMSALLATGPAEAMARYEIQLLEDYLL